MSMQDPIADMLARIKNAQRATKPVVSMPSSKIKVAIAKILQEQGFIAGYEVNEAQPKKPELAVSLKYYEGKPVIESLKRVSKTGLRNYVKSGDIPQVMNGLGEVIISTSQGIMTGKSAAKAGIGGEVICFVS